MAEQIPSIGRVVHYVFDNKHVPAIIIDPHQNAGETTALLFVMTSADQFTTFAEYDEAGAPATWHWPEYVPAKDAA